MLIDFSHVVILDDVYAHCSPHFLWHSLMDSKDIHFQIALVLTCTEFTRPNTNPHSQLHTASQIQHRTPHAITRTKPYYIVYEHIPLKEGHKCIHRSSRQSRVALYGVSHLQVPPRTPTCLF